MPRHKVETVATDMSPEHIGTIVDHLPQATIVFNHYHVIKLSGLGKDLCREIKESLQKAAATRIPLQPPSAHAAIPPAS